MICQCVQSFVCCCFRYGWGLLWCSISTVSSSLRVVSTVITTARWEGTITPTWPYLPATACSKWTAELCVILAVFRVSVETLISAPIDSVLTVFSPFSSLSAWQRDVWWWSLYVSNWTLTTDSFNRKLFLSQRTKMWIAQRFCLATHVASPPSHMHNTLCCYCCLHLHLRIS